jgi:sterol desaturase/sphingolipid hydroxylase (fatty acid hydroxylase superfamily)/rhodanese-related sulfurtransferase
MAETIRPFLFFGTLILLLVWETVHPFFDHFRRSAADRGRHLIRNFAVAVINALMVSAVFVTLWAIAASYSEAHRLGLLHRLDLPNVARVTLAIVMLDAWTYAWHWMNHRIPLLWRFHRMHHSDAQMDVTTANRFHFGEIAGSSLLRIPLILLLGVRLPELVLYEAMMFAVVQFHHANIGLPDWLDRALRVFIVTPAMHKVHHSREVAETNSNYTSFLSVWDRLFGTFRIRADAREIRFGLNEFDAQQDLSLAGMMRTPLKQLGTTSKTHLLYIGVILTLVALAGVFAAARRHSLPTWDDIERRIAAEYPDVRKISTTELDAWLHDSSKSPPILLDAREADEFAVSHLPGAIRVSPAASAVDLPPGVNKSAPIVVYCSVGYRSAGMAKRLQEAGFSDVCNLDGSIFRWANEGRPLLQGDNAVSVVHPYDEHWGTLLKAEHHPTTAPAR